MTIKEIKSQISKARSVRVGNEIKGYFFETDDFYLLLKAAHIGFSVESILEANEVYWKDRLLTKDQKSEIKKALNTIF
jgi:hypothetical protein